MARDSSTLFVSYFMVEVAAEVVREGLARVRGEKLSKPDWSRIDIIQELPISIIEPDPDNPRTAMTGAGLKDLVASIKRDGIQQPIKIRKGPEGEPYAIGGHRRLLGAEEAGLKTVPGILVAKPLTEVERQREMLLDNMHREDLGPVDKAKAYSRLMTSAGWNQSQLAADLCITPGEVSQALALLNLPDLFRNM